MLNRLRVISSNELEAIHQATIRLLEEKGIVFHHQEVLDIVKEHGARVEDNIVCFPQKLVEDNLKSAPPKFKWQARNETHSVIMGEGPLLQPAAGPICVQSLDGRRRLATPVNGFMTTGRQARAQLDMVEIAMGGRGSLEDKHCIGVSIGATSPLTYSWDPLETLLQYVRSNQMVHALCAPLVGVISPIGMMETVVLQNAELLAAIVLAQIVRPGAPVVYGPSATTADMQTGNYCSGSPEGMLMNIANIQMALDFYHLPARAMAGVTDAKVIDYQAEFETMQNLMLGMLAGAHLLNEAVGILDSILTVSYEKTIIDAELIRRVKCIMQGLDGPDRTVKLDTIMEIGHGGNYLLHDATLDRCRHRWRASLSFSGTYADWEKEGAHDIVQKANRKYKEILATAPKSLIDPAQEEELKAYIDSVM